jgi:hypothetical protein
VVRWSNELFLHHAAERLYRSSGDKWPPASHRINFACGCFDHSEVHLFDPCGAISRSNDDCRRPGIVDQPIRSLEAQVAAIPTRSTMAG